MSFALTHIDKSSPLPLYFQLKQLLLEGITGGKYQPGDTIPTEKELCEAYDISRTTVRQAVIELVNEGYLYRLKGIGTIVAQPKSKVNQDFMQKLESFDEQMARLGITPSTKILNFHLTAADGVVAQQLQMAQGTQTLHLRRLRYADDEPIVIVDSYLPAFCYNVPLEELQQIGLYQTLKNRFNTRIVRARREVEAVLSNPEQSLLLQIPNNSALQHIRTVGFNQDNLPVEYSIAYYRGDKNRFTIELAVEV